jgi:hypothetical protein
MKTIQLLTVLTFLVLLSQCVVSRVQEKVSDKIDNFPLEHQAKDDGCMDRLHGRPESHTSHADHYTPATEVQYAKAYHGGYYMGRSAAKKVAQTMILHGR